MDKPADTAIIAAFAALYADPLLSLPSLQARALANCTRAEASSADPLAAGPRLRSVHWRHYFHLLPAPLSPAAAALPHYTLQLTRARADYTALCATYLVPPERSDPGSAGVEINNPLSQAIGVSRREFTPKEVTD